MTLEITLGGLASTQHMAENLALPFMDDLPIVGLIHDALDQAATERKGVLVVGEKGVGKTETLSYAREAFAEAERQKAAADASYRRRHVVYLQTVRGQSYRELFKAIHKVALGAELNERVRGRLKSDNDMRIELVDMLLELNYVLIVIDEAETLSPVLLTAVRDLVAEGESRADGRRTDAGITAQGLGVVLVGVDRHLTTRLMAAEEAERRFVRRITVEGPPQATVPGLYATWLPGFAPHIKQVGGPEWRQYIATTVTRGRTVPLSLIENHVRNYARLAIRNDDGITAPADIPFIEELFVFTLGEAEWTHASSSGAGR